MDDKESCMDLNRLRYELSELDALGELWPGGAINPVQLSSGSLGLRLDGVEQEGFSVMKLSLKPRVADRNLVGEGHTGFVFAERPIIWGGAEISPPALLIERSGREYRSLLEPGFCSFEFFCTNASLRGHPLGYLCDRLAEVPLDFIPLKPSQAARLKEVANAYISLAGTSSDLEDCLSANERRKPVLDVIGGILGEAMDCLKGREVCLTRNRRSLALAALDEIDRIGVHDAKVSDLYRSLGVSRRALEKAFSATLRVSPGQYILACRLNQLRRDLLGTSARVIDSIFDAGFADASRAANQYRRLFGELPSATLKRAQTDCANVFSAQPGSSHFA
jgi:AraC-like DNA-binding protein